MAWRFKVSKYKNAVGVVPRKEDWLTDIKVGSPQSCGNHIKASAAFMAFNVENRGGGSLGVMPLHSKGRMDPNSPLLHAHSDLITDFDFSPFDDGMLATGSTDANVHIWHIPESGLSSSLSSPSYSLPQFDKRVENVLFHPTTEFVLTVSYYDTVKLWDILHEKELFCCRDATDQVQSTSWKDDGTQFVTSAKDKTLRIHDPRAGSVVMKCASHPSPKDSRVVWLGAGDTILSTGYSQSRMRELLLRDLRAFDKPFKTQPFDSSTGILLPLYDADTRMLFLAGKADVSIMYWEVADKEPFLTEGLKHSGSVQTKGACLVPKRGVDAMAGEVNRVLQLTSSAVIPITYQVPRKTFREFHTDLFPDTNGVSSAQTVAEWASGGNGAVVKTSLDPGRRTAPTLQIHRGPLQQRQEEPCSSSSSNTNGVSSSSSNGGSKSCSGSSNGVPVPAPRSRAASETNNRTGAATERNNASKPTVAVKPSMVTPKPAQRSSVLQHSNSVMQQHSNNRERCYNQLNTSASVDHAAQQSADDSGTITTSLAQLRKNFEANSSAEKSDCSKGEKAQRDSTGSSNINSLMKAYEGMDIKDGGHNKEDKPQLGDDESCSKLASIRAQFEGRSTSCDDQQQQQQVGSTEEEEQRPSLEDADEDEPPADNKQTLADSQVGSEVLTPGGSVLVCAAPSSPASLRRNTTTRTRSFRRICKFRHLKGTAGHRSSHIENLRDLSRTTPGESDGICCNSVYVVLPLTGAGGKVSVLRHQKGGRQPDGVIPAFLSGANVLDFALDPFNESTLLTACDDGKILQWRIPEDGLQQSSNEPERVFCDSTDKVSLLKFHPLASDVVAAVCGDYVIRIWDLTRQAVAIALQPHPDQVFSAAWSPCGVFLATLCRDGRVRVFDPRKSSGPCREGVGPQGVRGGRVLWALNGRFLVTSGASKTSQREISVYRSSDLSAPVHTLPLDQSPAILVPYYDEDSSTLFVTAKGESSINCYEVGADAPHLFPLSHHKSPSVHQGLTFLPKHTCDVRSVEFARALRLTHNTLEPLSFTVPRVKTSLFQDDLFPPTAVSWQPRLSAEDWLAGSNKNQLVVSLQPPDMDSLSASRDSPPSESGSRDSNPSPRDSCPPLTREHSAPVTPACLRNLPEEVRETQNKLEHSMSEQISVSSALEQDHFEGVDKEEWLED